MTDDVVQSLDTGYLYIGPVEQFQLVYVRARFGHSSLNVVPPKSRFRLAEMSPYMTEGVPLRPLQFVRL